MFRPTRFRHEPRPEADARATRRPGAARSRFELYNALVEHRTMFDGKPERIGHIHVAGVKDILFMPAASGPPAVRASKSPTGLT
jgi:hypothetical protein